jgi:hypothetical protein
MMPRRGQAGDRERPGSSAGYASLGAIEAATGDLEHAEASFKQAVATEPNEPLAWPRQPLLVDGPLATPSGRSGRGQIQPDNPITNQALAMLYPGRDAGRGGGR